MDQLIEDLLLATVSNINKYTGLDGGENPQFNLSALQAAHMQLGVALGMAYAGLADLDNPAVTAPLFPTN